MSATSAAREASSWPRASGDIELQRLLAALDFEILTSLGWEPSTKVFRPAADDPIFGFQLCQRCPKAKRGSSPVCRSCQTEWERHWESQGRGSWEDFLASEHRRKLRSHAVPGLCLVCRTPGHERAAYALGLCGRCYRIARKRKQSVAAYIEGDDRHPPATPAPSLGPCRVSSCMRLADHRATRLCDGHHRRWMDDRGNGQDFDRWCATRLPLCNDSRWVVLRGLEPRLEAEILFFIQRRHATARRTEPMLLSLTIAWLRRQEVASVLDLTEEQREQDVDAHIGYFVRFLHSELRWALTPPEIETAKLRWDLRALGHKRGWLDFGELSQPWLQRSAMAWAERKLTRQAPGTVQDYLRPLGLLSAHLRASRRDQGIEPRVLGRNDVVGLLRRFLMLRNQGQMTAETQRRWLVHLRVFLRDSREWGLTSPGRPMAGLPEEFALHDADLPQPDADEDGAGRALPQVVMNQLFGFLDEFEAVEGRTMRMLVELQMHEGLRPAEICGLAWDCLTGSADADPRPVLLYDMPKVRRVGCRRPISELVASLISAQKAHVREQFPKTPLGGLQLFPRPTRNPDGTEPIATPQVGMAVRRWADRLPSLVGPDGEPLDPSRIFMYAFRHTYAQRHADSGTPPDVLRDLMGHRQMATTQGYYRVTEQRKRRAVDALVSLACNKDGTSLSRALDTLVDEEYQRQQVGQVAVPMGWCVEPSNVKASGQACPFRYRCAGCNHFRTDPSYLPELESYLQALLADRERLQLAIPELEEWARNDAMPSDQEIEKLRSLISKLRRRLDDLPSETRAHVDDAIRQLRTTRAQAGSVPVRLLAPRLGAAR